MNILQRPPDRGYPTEYLLSRIRGRKVRYGDSIAGESPEGVWRRLLLEYRWVYSQMNKGLQDVFLPFFIYFELKTLFICLRYKSAGNLMMPEMLKFSLLSEEVKELLKSDTDMSAVVGKIEKTLMPFSPGFSGLKEKFVTGDLMALEQKITNAFLEYAITACTHPLIRHLFAYIIDSKNIISLYKHLRWKMGRPIFISGGSMPEKRLMRIFEGQDISGVLFLINKLTAIAIENIDASNVENSLHEGMTDFLKRNAADPLSIGVIVRYLWRCYLETINKNIAFYGAKHEGMREMIH